MAKAVAKDIERAVYDAQLYIGKGLRMRLAAGFDRIIYVTDAAQGEHFRQLFAAARASCYGEQPADGGAGPAAP
jgi:arginyl-tRNA synthetase